MKRWFVFFMSCLIWNVANAISCEEDMKSQFENVWKQYYNQALTSDGKTMEKYFNFPLKLRGLYDGDKPTPIAKKFFLKNYSLIFIKNKVTKNTKFYLDFPKWREFHVTDDMSWVMRSYCDGKQSGAIQFRHGDIVVQWFSKSGWKIVEIFYDPDDNDDLFHSANNPDLEYTFP